MTRLMTMAGMAGLAVILSACNADAQPKTQPVTKIPEIPSVKDLRPKQPVQVQKVEAAPAKATKVEYITDVAGKRHYTVTFDSKPWIGASSHVQALLKALAVQDGTVPNGEDGSEPGDTATTRKYTLGYKKTGGRAVVKSAQITNQVAGNFVYVVTYTSEPKISDVNALAEALAAFEKSYFDDPKIKHTAKVTVDPKKPEAVTITVTLTGGTLNYLKGLRGETGNLP